VLSEIAAGRKKPTKLGYLAGVEKILPAKNHYTKKIVVLINEVDFSAAEFLAAMLQDSKRATLFGQRTAGAGGCAKAVSVPNADRLGIESLTVRWTLAWRVTGRPIEGLGVHPDVHYSITAEDLRFGHRGYRQALLAAIGA
jgi:C-terminal processing protease CtpA/Prc